MATKIQWSWKCDPNTICYKQIVSLSLVAWNNSSERCALPLYLSEVLTQVPSDDIVNIVSYLLMKACKQGEERSHPYNILKVILHFGTICGWCLGDTSTYSFPPKLKEPSRDLSPTKEEPSPRRISGDLSTTKGKPCLRSPGQSIDTFKACWRGPSLRSPENRTIIFWISAQSTMNSTSFWLTQMGEAYSVGRAWKNITSFTAPQFATMSLKPLEELATLPMQWLPEEACTGWPHINKNCSGQI